MKERLSALFSLEGKFLLGEVAEADYQEGGEYLAYCWIEMEVIYEQFEEEIVQQYTDTYQDKVPDQLYASSQVGVGEDDELAEQEPGGECDGHGHEQGGDMRAEGDEPQRYHLLLQDEVIADKIQDNVQQGIAAPACQVAKGLQGH